MTAICDARIVAPLVDRYPYRSSPSPHSLLRHRVRQPSLFGRIVATSASHPLMVLLLVTLLTVASLVYTARHFVMTTDTAELISTKLQWRQRELAFEAAFPQLQKLVTVVVDGATPNWPTPRLRGSPRIGGKTQSVSECETSRRRLLLRP